MIIKRAADDGDFYGLPCDLVSSSNAGGNGVTDGETSLCNAQSATHGHQLITQKTKVVL